jgi:predicted enzyme related to lactoylglutathione lyase
MSGQNGRVIGIGGVFRRVADPSATAEWYGRVFGLDFQDWGGVRGLAFPAEDMAGKQGAAGVFSVFPEASDYFAPAEARVMINLAVDDIQGVLARAAAAGVTPVRTMLDDPSGKFAHILDPDGYMLELWEPVSPA